MNIYSMKGVCLGANIATTMSINLIYKNNLKSMRNCPLKL